MLCIFLQNYIKYSIETVVVIAVVVLVIVKAVVVNFDALVALYSFVDDFVLLSDHDSLISNIYIYTQP